MHHAVLVNSLTSTRDSFIGQTEIHYYLPLFHVISFITSNSCSFACPRTLFTMMFGSTPDLCSKANAIIAEPYLVIIASMWNISTHSQCYSQRQGDLINQNKMPGTVSSLMIQSSIIYRFTRLFCS